MQNKKAAVFILLGQSNAVGHGIPMTDDDKIITPLKNVFGLNRCKNQSFDNETLFWDGYTSYGMNIAEDQDNTYSLANCLAKLWQDAVDRGAELPDLYIVHIAIGAQGVFDNLMWNPDYEKKLIPGKLGAVDISLFPFTVHILSKIKKSLLNIGKEVEKIQIHWRGGEEDMLADTDALKSKLTTIYEKIFSSFYDALDEKVETILHKIVCHEHCYNLDKSGKAFENMNYINEVFQNLSDKSDHIKIFDVCNAPHYKSDVRGNGIFIDDFVHFSPQTNQWVSEEIFKSYKS